MGDVSTVELSHGMSMYWMRDEVVNYLLVLASHSSEGNAAA